MLDHIYLKPNVIVEPLFNQWYAWSYLIPPATAAMYVTHSHLKILESFIEAPQVHISALKNPAMLGGPFINYDLSKVEEIRALLEKTKQEQEELLILATAIQSLERMLIEEATGYSLESFYAKVPEALQGYVELVYDTNHHASFRLIEGLLYQSSYYKPKSQSIALYLGDEDIRSFVLSTPRLPNAQSLHIPLPFSDRRFEQLFKMKEQPGSYSAIIKALEIQNTSLFASFFTQDTPQREPKYQGEDVRIRYFGHACILIETKHVTILCDPLVSYQHSHGIPRYSYANLPEVIDYVLITHNHQDHVMLETLLQLRYKIKQVIVPKSNKGSLIDPSLKLILQQIGFTNVREIDELESLTIPEGQITSWPFLGEHGDLNIAAKTAYLVQLQGKSILCAADSNNIEPKLYDRLRHLVDEIDVLFIGMECEGAPYTWAYGALLSQIVPRKMAQTRRLDGSNAERAIKLVNQLRPKQVYVYAMGQEPWLSFITSIQYTNDSKAIVESNQLVNYCRSQNKISERLFGSKEIYLNPTQEQQNMELTTPVTQLLLELSQLDIKLWVEGYKLRCNAPKGALTSSLKEQIQERKTEIIEILNNQFSSTTTQTQSTEEIILDSEIIPSVVTQSSTQPANILLTGATGFLGSFLLSELLKRTSAGIYCLVRAETIELAWQKLKSNLEFYLVWDESSSQRITLILGDLSKALLGLSQETFEKLSEQIDTIYHNGAWVHHASPYSLLKATNVLGTQEVLRLACHNRVKPVHFISTISVFPPDASTKIFTETDNIAEYEPPYGGYARSKWVAEQLVTQAQKRGLPVNIYRLGPISGHSKTGVFNGNDFLYRLIIGCTQLGSAPEGERILDILPVDYASEAIACLSQKPELLNQTFHLIHPQPVSSTVLFEELRAWGYRIERIPYDKWYAKLLNIAQGSSQHTLYPLVSLFSPGSVPESDEKPLMLKFDSQNTEKGLSESDLNCPSLDCSLFKTYLSYLVRSGSLEVPPSSLLHP
ncbi:thioester reductase domain-containing protein [Gloeocapsa sp. PCC 73106]|uniref:thioester reductase domain-containing protein n=1 Tax=Gloeocapsa sp. PCC 73106 TaxID=102232 RepID=UPI0002ABD1C0|nr:thioester reductase domain-containing protein [Gloeocapsa sp. PCC 73106]ELR97037.1 thioester reductase-like protein [Gloeocapsa sp. PCC 73106]